MLTRADKKEKFVGVKAIVTVETHDGRHGSKEQFVHDTYRFKTVGQANAWRMEVYNIEIGPKPWILVNKFLGIEYGDTLEHICIEEHNADGNVYEMVFKAD